MTVHASEKRSIAHLLSLANVEPKPYVTSKVQAVNSGIKPPPQAQRLSPEQWLKANWPTKADSPLRQRKPIASRVAFLVYHVQRAPDEWGSYADQALALGYASRNSITRLHRWAATQLQVDLRTLHSNYQAHVNATQLSTTQPQNDEPRNP